MSHGCTERCTHWPCPNLRCIPCVWNFSVDEIERAVIAATEDTQAATCWQYPGCWCYAKIQLCRPCSCPTDCRCGLDRVDLLPIVKYPALEVVDVEIDGVSQGPGGWAIDAKRWLYPIDGHWPAQSMGVPYGEPCTWSVTVRYGKDVPTAVLIARDEKIAEYLGLCASTIRGCQVEGDVTRVTMSGRTVEYRPSSHRDRFRDLIGPYRCRKRNRARLVDLQQPADGVVTWRILPGGTPDPLPSGYPEPCDLQDLVDQIYASSQPTGQEPVTADPDPTTGKIL